MGINQQTGETSNQAISAAAATMIASKSGEAAAPAAADVAAAAAAAAAGTVAEAAAEAGAAGEAPAPAAKGRGRHCVKGKPAAIRVSGPPQRACSSGALKKTRSQRTNTMLKRATELSVRTGDTAFAMNVKTHRAVLCQDGIEVKLTQATLEDLSQILLKAAAEQRNKGGPSTVP